MNPIYYYIRDKNNHPIITVCLLENNGDISRGIAVCSKQESPWKNYGRALAFKRARKAIKAQQDLFMVVRDEIVIILTELDANREFFWYKGKFNPALTEYEMALLEKK